MGLGMMKKKKKKKPVNIAERAKSMGTNAIVSIVGKRRKMHSSPPTLIQVQNGPFICVITTSITRHGDPQIKLACSAWASPAPKRKQRKRAG